MRPRRIFAIARQDWANELKGRQGLVLPAVIAGLLLPASTVPSPVDRAARRYQDQSVIVSGDVPPEVAVLQVVRPDGRNRLHFERGPDGVLLVYGPRIPDAVRRVLDGERPAVVVEPVERGFRFPGRTMLLSLITSSTLTGAVSASIGGERSRRTLVVLLAAAVTRAEIVLGKWSAWAAVGGGSALVAALAAVGLGRVEPGWWLVPLPTVPLATVALGLWLVRRATDVVVGTATTLRVLPAALALTGIGSWLLGEWSPWLGAVVPLGGALVAAGATWDGAGPPILAAASTLAVTAGWIAATVRDLEEESDRDPPERKTQLALAFGALAAACWWLPVALPLLWTAAGNPRIVEALPLESGILAGAACLGAATLVRLGRTTGHVEPELGIRPAPAWLWAAAVVGGVALALAAPASSLVPPPGSALLASIGERLAAAVQPAALGPAMAVIVAEELVFRGWLLRAVGPLRSGIAWAVVKAPFDPVGGLLAAGVLGGAGAVGGPVAGMLVRASWWAAAAFVPALPPVVALLVGVGAVVVLVAAARRHTSVVR